MVTHKSPDAAVKQAFRLLSAEYKFVREALVPCVRCECAKFDHASETMKCPYAPSTFSAMPAGAYLVLSGPDSYSVLVRHPQRELYSFTTVDLLPYWYTL